MELNIVQMYLKDLNIQSKNADQQEIEKLIVNLIELEKKFVKKLRATKGGKPVFEKFINKLNTSNGGIKSARIYFREREENYKKHINPLISKCDVKMIVKTPLNFKFASFAIDQIKTPHLESIFKEMKDSRDKIVNQCLYLAINKAKNFNRNIYGSGNEFSDLIQACNEGLISAVDKYVLNEEGLGFFNVAIVSMSANLIVNFSVNSPISIGEHYRKKIYRIKKMLQSNPNLTTKAIAEAMQVAEGEIADLLAASTFTSLDQEVSEDSSSRLIDFLENPEHVSSPEDDAVVNELKSSLLDRIELLSIIDRKILFLKRV